MQFDFPEGAEGVFSSNQSFIRILGVQQQY